MDFKCNLYEVSQSSSSPSSAEFVDLDNDNGLGEYLVEGERGACLTEGDSVYF